MDANGTAVEVGLVPEFPATFGIEEGFNFQSSGKLLVDYCHHSLYYSAFYLLATLLGQNYMRNRKAWTLKWPMVLWNLSLAAFSVCGAIRSVHALAYALKEFGLEHTVCDNRYIRTSPVLGFWMAGFVLSKVLELLDTAFVVLRKQNLIFLHWFHHSSVLVFTWYTAADQMAMGRWFITMNYVVHSLMYSYYTLRAVKVRVPRWVALLITSVQIVQMFVGLYISLTGMAYYFQRRDCALSASSCALSVSIYSFYFVLFCRFFVSAYFTGALHSIGRKKSQ